MITKLLESTPYVRYVHYIEMIPQYTTHQQVACDHRIFFCVNGEYSISAGSSQFHLKENSLVYIPSGVAYHLHRPSTKIELLGINFDFTQDHNNMSFPIPPTFNATSCDPSTLLEVCNFSDISDFNAPFIIHSQRELLPCVQKMLDEYTTKRLFYEEQCSALLKQLLMQLGRVLLTGYSDIPQSTADKVISYIQENYMRHISNTDIGRELNFHPNYLNRLMILNTGTSLHKYLLNYRLTKALDLLASTPLSITEISRRCGFTDVQQFCKFFQSQMGCSPGSFK